MLKNIIRNLIIVISIVLLTVSTSKTTMEWISDKRNENSTWWGAHETHNGDLVRMSYLDFAEKYCTQLDYSFKRPAYNGLKKIDLYTSGDSYIFKIPDSAYAGIRSYHFAWRFWKDLTYHLDTSENNILIIEIAERYLRSYFKDMSMFKHVYDTARKGKGMQTSVAIRKNNYSSGIAINGLHLYDLFNPNINQNLEYNLFDYNFITPVIHAKATFNYFVFGRASGDVTLSGDKNYLFLSETVNPYSTGSSFSPLTSQDISILIHNLNRVYDHYKADGFKEIYLSIIPSPATILQPDGYNRLIPQVQQNPQLKMKVIDIYTIFKKTREKIYRPGDTHWNNKGLQIWLNEVNSILIKQNK